MSDQSFEALPPERRRRLARPAARSSERLYDQESDAVRLQRRLGNARLLQLRAVLQRRTWNPDWLQELPDDLQSRAHQNADAAEQRTDTGLAAADTMLGTGRPLDADVRSRAESSLGVSMEGVSVVQNADAATGPLEAKAFAATDGGGRHTIALAGDVDVGSDDGQFTLAHELAHVAQQKRGQADSLDGVGGDEAVRTDLEDDADRRARRMLRG